MDTDPVTTYATAAPPPPHELVLESGDLGAEAADEIHVLRDVMVHVQGVAGGVRLDVLGAVGILEGIEGFFEGGRCATASTSARGGLKNKGGGEKGTVFSAGRMFFSIVLGGEKVASISWKKLLTRRRWFLKVSHHLFLLRQGQPTGQHAYCVPCTVLCWCVSGEQLIEVATHAPDVGNHNRPAVTPQGIFQQAC